MTATERSRISEQMEAIIKHADEVVSMISAIPGEHAQAVPMKLILQNLVGIYQNTHDLAAAILMSLPDPEAVTSF